MYPNPSQNASESSAGGSHSAQGAGLESGRDSQHSPPHSSQQRIRRRNRLITSCLECRRRKLKCDKLQPCTNCTRFKRDCLFLAPALDHASQQKLAEIKEKMGTLERTLEEDIARKRQSKRENSLSERIPGQDQDSEDDGTPPEDERDLEINTLALAEVAYGGEPDDDLTDLGIQIGKMRITDRVGGYFRPKVYEEMRDSFSKIPELDTTDIPPMIRGTTIPGGPRSDFVPPSSGFFFAPPIKKPQPLLASHLPPAAAQASFGQASIMQYLPMRGMADKLMEQYWLAVHPICRIVHRPTFEREYTYFWNDLSTGIEPRKSFMALLFSALFSAVVSLSEDGVYETYAVDKAKLVENFREGTELALSLANFLRTTKLETLQAFVAYLLPLCRGEISRAHAALTGTAIRLAECMGMHRDGTNFSLSPVETHVRRLVWYELCALDLRTCEACGPRPQIRMEDYDTRMPLNVDDVELESVDPPTKDSTRFTDVTASRIKFECNEIHRLFWFERMKLGRGKISVTSLLGRGEKFKAAMEKTYYPMLDLRVPLHFMTLQMYRILSLRLHSMLLHRYASNSRHVMPDRLRNIMVSSVTLVMEHSITIETNPSIRPWAWYSATYHQWHVALLAIGELYAKPPPKSEEERIWRCLDYAFELPSQLTPAEKGRIILGDLRGKTELYQRLHYIHIAKNRPESSAQETAFVKKLGEKDPTRPSMSPTSSVSPQARPAEIRTSTVGMVNNVANSAVGPASIGNPYNLVGATGAMPPMEYAARNLPGGIGDSFYAPPMTQQVALGSPPTSDTSADMGAQRAGGVSSNESMLDIDWNEWDKLFPQSTNMNSENLNIPPFSFPESMGGTMSWQNPPQGW